MLVVVPTRETIGITTCTVMGELIIVRITIRTLPVNLTNMSEKWNILSRAAISQILTINHQQSTARTVNSEFMT